MDEVRLADPKKDHEIIWNAKSLTIDNGILIRPPRPGALGRNRPYLPPGELRKRVVHFFHEDLTTGHQSVRSTLERIQTRYWWDEKAMKDAVENRPRMSILFLQQGERKEVSYRTTANAHLRTMARCAYGRV